MAIFEMILSRFSDEAVSLSQVKKNGFFSKNTIQQSSTSKGRETISIICQQSGVLISLFRATIALQQ